MKKMKILAIDDNTVNLATIEQELKEEYEVVPMITGRRAVQYLYCERVDLILLDVQMPVMDGMQTLKEIRKLENGVTTPVIFLTAMKDKDTVIEGSKLGIMDYITKPFNGEDLRKRIERVFKRLGIKPIEDSELIVSIQNIMKALEGGKTKQAAALMDEVMGYQIKDEISGRVRNARNKLDKEDIQAAKNAIQRLLHMMTQADGENHGTNGVKIEDRVLYAELLHIKEHVETLQTKEAIKECQALTRYMLPDVVKEKLDIIMGKLVEYDDEEADTAIKQLMHEVAANMS